MDAASNIFKIVLIIAVGVVVWAFFSKFTLRTEEMTQPLTTSLSRCPTYDESRYYDVEDDRTYNRTYYRDDPIREDYTGSRYDMHSRMGMRDTTERADDALYYDDTYLYGRRYDIYDKGRSGAFTTEWLDLSNAWDRVDQALIDDVTYGDADILLDRAEDELWQAETSYRVGKRDLAREYAAHVHDLIRRAYDELE